MEYLALIGTVTLIHLLGVISPGPDFIVVVKNSLTYSRRTGIWTAVGMGAGISVHMLYCVLGLALLISQSILLFTIIKFLGAAYLVYLGITAILSKSQAVSVTAEESKAEISRWQAVRIGFLTNALNPKVTLFFLSLFTLVIDPATPGIILMVMSLIMITNTTLWFTIVALAFTQERVQHQLNRFQSVFNKFLGGALVALGIKVAFTDR